MNELILNPDKANERIHELEKQLGLPRTADAEHIGAAWSRIELLEEMAAGAGAKHEAEAGATYAEDNAVIHDLEAKLGLPRSADVAHSSATHANEEATNRLQYLYEVAHLKAMDSLLPLQPTATGAATPAPAAPRAAPVASEPPPAAPARHEGGPTGLARAIAANKRAASGAAGEAGTIYQPSGLARAIAANKRQQASKS